ncbi:lysozyme [Pasteurella testudinis DSM 23072]|uniref:Lysozyme n=1 Tax=Pasteurella testudinis DSM 23072 TaxID=1122938 RepID=A0A1W1V408_9PAST|nr:lysozyme [Pasteurella testudinis]SMB88035.1 lysozyme [Pasteurella testudinis DSM 23072]SUB51619.1 lysozyme [Pasteurella testudinis]
MREISIDGLRALQYDEGDRLTAYKDGAGIWTIGTGHTGKVDGVPIRAGMTITKAKSLELLREDVRIAENGVNYHVKRAITQQQFDAFVNLAFNIGVGAFAGSTALREFNKGNTKKAGEAIGYWNKLRNPRTKQLEFSQGLANRRVRNRRMFERGEYVTA